jgi:hypothetical protein
MMENRVPARLIAFWDQGFENAPPIVKLCLDSWRKFAPGYELLLLDRSNVAHHFPGLAGSREFQGSNIQVKSDLLRLEAVSSLGGIWVDATLFFAKPTGNFVPGQLASGFLAVALPPKSNRFIQSYFIAGTPGSPFLLEWARRLRAFASYGLGELPRRMKKRIKRHAPLLFTSKLGTTIWTFRAISAIRGYPYLIAHFIANRMIIFSPRWRAEFKAMPKVHAVTGIHLARTANGIDIARNLLEEGAFPLWKLDWKDMQNYPEFWRETEQMLRVYLAETPVAEPAGG